MRQNPFEQHDDPSQFQSDKALLRTRLLALGATVPWRSVEERSRAIVERLVLHPLFDSARVVVLADSRSALAPVLLRSLAQQARLMCKTVGHLRFDEEGGIEFRATDSEDCLEDRGRPFAEAPATAPVLPPGMIDLLVVPVLAADSTGRFLSDGSGRFDRAIRLLPSAKVVAVALDFLIIPNVPTTAGDASVDLVVTDSRVFEARATWPDRTAAAESPGQAWAAKEVRRASALDDPGRSSCGSGDRMGKYLQAPDTSVSGKQQKDS